jgi:hypothetical protein
VTLSEMTVAELAARQRDLKHQQSMLKIHASQLQEELARRFKGDAQFAYDAQGKAHGTVRVLIKGGATVKVDTKQTVSWDQEKCRALAADMTWEQVQHYFTIKFDVKESVYKALPPGDNFKPGLTEARVTKIGEPTYELLTE